MDFTLFKKVTDTIVSWGIECVSLHNFGEPLLHPKIIDMVIYAKKAGVPHVNFTSNAALLGDSLAKDLLNTGLDLIQFSVHAGSESSYDIIQKGGDFQKALENIRKFSLARKELKRKNPYIVLKSAVSNVTISELEEVIRSWMGLVDEIQLSAITDFEGIQSRNLNLNRTAKKELIVCPGPFSKLHVQQDGDIILCCFDVNNTLKIGNANSDDLISLWHSPQINRLRRRFLKKDYTFYPCVDCGAVNAFARQNSISQIKENLNKFIHKYPDIKFKVLGTAQQFISVQRIRKEK